MNDAVDLLEVYNTGGQTLAAQSDVIELIYQAAKAKMTGADGQPKPGGRALMDMLRQLLGMDHDAQSAEQQEGDEKGRKVPRKAAATIPDAERMENPIWPPPRIKAFPIRTRLWKRVPFPNPPACPQTTCLPNSARRWTPTTRLYRGKTPLSGHSPFTHEQQLPVSMKNPRLLLTAFLTCCMTAAPQNAAAQSPMRTSSSVPPQVELMYVKGLRYLQNAQKTDGTYDGTYGREPGIIGFCLMSVLAHGDDPNAGPYATMVRRCVDYILSKQNKVSGYIGDSMYNHGFATLALAEAYGMVRDDRIGPALRKAVALTLTAQKKQTGGWRYSPESTDADSTVTGCQIVSLFAARNAGIPVPDEAFERGLKYMASCRDKKAPTATPGRQAPASPSRPSVP